MKQEDPGLSEVCKEVKKLVLLEMARLREMGGHDHRTIRSTAIGLVAARCATAFAQLGRSKDKDLTDAETTSQEEAPSAEVVQGNFGQSASA